MPSIEVRNLDNQPVGQLALADAVFAAKVNPHLLYEAVRHYMACRRAGTHATKTRGLVSGSGRKLWRQKGTGRARIGSIRSPLWRHGGTVFGPQPRDYSYRLPRKMLLGALRSALSAKLAEEQMIVVDEFKLDTNKTKQLREILDRFDGAGPVLLVDLAGNRNLALSARNLEGVELVTNRELHPYHLLQCRQLLISRPAAERLQEALAP